MTSVCTICEKIRYYLENLADTGEINCGPIQKASGVDCQIHGPILKQFYGFCYDDRTGQAQSEDVGFIAYGQGCSLVLTQSISRFGFIWELLLVKRDSTPNHMGIGRVLSSDWVDLDILKKWKSECLRSHGSKCGNPLKVWPMRPAWLIDIERKCIVPGNNGSEYVALSYRWGDFNFKLSKAALEKFQEPYIFNSDDVMAGLAPIVRHAMHLTGQLGERYLWLDSLCISHGDTEDMTEQLNSMGAIYANALVTLIAADEDAQTGILGLKDVSASREMSQRVFTFGQDKLIVRNTGKFDLGSGTEYYKRGWTYQEYMMSKRKILFNQKEVHWECSCCVWHEELQFGHEVSKYINPRLRVITAGFPDMESLDHCIADYNERELTFDEDALAGFSGLLSVFSRSFPGGFLYGLAETQFERCLCWRPHGERINLKRRVPSSQSYLERVSSFALPSWSWVGWQGMVGWDHDAVRVHPRYNRFCETIPITEWSTWDIKSRMPIRRIRSTWLEKQSEYKDHSRPLPPGWTRHDPSEAGSFRGEPLLWPDGCGEHVYKHANMPDDGYETWSYPFPVADIQSTTLSDMPEQVAYIFCKTKRARVRGRRAVPLDQHMVNLDNKISLYNTSDQVIGFLHLHNDTQLRQFPTTEAREYKSVDLVAICQSRVYSKGIDQDNQTCVTTNPPEDLYRVLWVEWVDDIAYRCAGGMVNKDHWETLLLDDIDLVLG
ncbi:hypothetical protein BP5796_13236 [Coleophoma crateriformis]|uniref:Heterokaryon incompatibility domain-containing protein n=1 Tax=Coleophoma crateriformis TaxID=565419 RepID=A0A3D8Q375_9HELO|nr:hypothetical protein BP5796_13236 [Coleophoma crateriformis]